MDMKCVFQATRLSAGHAPTHPPHHLCVGRNRCTGAMHQSMVAVRGDELNIRIKLWQVVGAVAYEVDADVGRCDALHGFGLHPASELERRT